MNQTKTACFPRQGQVVFTQAVGSRCPRCQLGPTSSRGKLAQLNGRGKVPFCDLTYLPNHVSAFKSGVQGLSWQNLPIGMWAASLGMT